jgi:hypothetical protein
VATWMVLVEASCADPDREDEFNEWYNEVHLADVLETPGIVRAVRYENIAPTEGQGKYLAVYEVETDDLQDAFAANEEIMARKSAEGRMSALLQIRSVTSFKQLHSLSERILVANH